MTLSRRALAVALAGALLLGVAGPASAQLGRLASPGPLSAPHASLEGLANCQQCHEPGRQVTATKCLACHQPVAVRMRAKTGVHRDVTTDCVTCHVEHAGRDAELRPLDAATFDHAAETGFPLDGRHAPVAADCAKCHKTRSYLTVKADCASCHEDVHQGALSRACQTCHPVSAAFTDARRTYDHAASAFPLTGAHADVACAKCHTDKRLKGVAFASCASCHKDPHTPALGADCTRCHTTRAWRTDDVNHDRTRFPLKGAHQTVACRACHVQPPMVATPKSARCADCHTDPHKGQFKDDCSACHTERAFRPATPPFDHAARTTFPLTGAHAPLACLKCHTRAETTGALAGRVVDFGGAKTDCASCHDDPHKGELGAACQTCHGTTTFHLDRFDHEPPPDFFAGVHAGVTCAGCHQRETPVAPTRSGVPLAGVRFRGVPRACAACHKDPHLGQVGAACETCHSLAGAKFAVVGFSHDRSAFPLTGKHADVACEKCHAVESGTFPLGEGTARRLRPVRAACAACHEDPHLGQLDARCETCHSTTTFKLPGYTHRGLDDFFTGAHKRAKCEACHERAVDDFPAGRGTAVRFKTGTTCVNCHEDPHQGALGTDCGACHQPQLAAAHRPAPAAPAGPRDRSTIRVRGHPRLRAGLAGTGPVARSAAATEREP
ncbi:MAG: cytochrome c3 family protein [Vicinamibacterales bacterium]